MADQMAELMILVEAVGIDKAIASLDKAQKKMGDTAKKAKNDTKALEQFAQKFGGAMAIISGALTASVGALLVQVPIMGELFDAVSYFVETLAYALDDVLRPVINPLIDAIYWLSDEFEKLSPFMQKVILIIGGIIAVVLIFVTALIGLAVWISTLSAGVLVFLATFALITTAILGVIANIAFLVIAFGPLALTILAMVLLWKKFGDDIKDIISKVLDVVRLTFKWISDAVKFGIEKAVGFFGGIGDAWGDIWGGIKDKVTEIWDSIITTVGKKVGDVKDKIVEKVAVIKSYWSTFWDGLKDTVTNAFGFIKNIFNGLSGIVKGVLNGIITLANSMIDSLNSISVKIPDWVPGDMGGKNWSLGLPKIPSLRTEGIIDKSGVAEVHSGEGVFAMETLQNAMYNAMVMAGMNGGQSVKVYLDGRLVSEALGNSDNVNLGSQGGGY